MSILQDKVEQECVRWSSEPMPLEGLASLRDSVHNFMPMPDCLYALMPEKIGYGRDVADNDLARLLGDRELGLWTLSVGSIDALGEIIRRQRPGCVVEFGCGVSTLALRVFLDRQVGRDARIVSVEQSGKYLDEARDELRRHGLDRGIRWVHAPVSPARPMFDELNEPLDRYDLAGVRQALGDDRAELVLVDGPSGAPGCRIHVLPDMLPMLAPEALVLLDDAVRDGEIRAAACWDTLPGVNVRGVVMTGKGLLVASVSQ